MEEYADILQEDWNTLLTSEEQEVFFNLSHEEQEAYLTASQSYEAMKLIWITRSHHRRPNGF